jgi:SAM-dependent methyltransferase
MKSSFAYQGFDYSENMVQIARRANPDVSIDHGDVTKYRPQGEPNDLIILIGGLHHVFSRARDVVARLAAGLRRGGYFLSFEPTHDNWVARRVRQRIYQSNAIFDADTEQGFEYRELKAHFEACGFELVDEVFPGLLAYVLYYNPDAFPLLNIGGTSVVKWSFAIDRVFWANAVGRKLSFATIGLWRRKQ